MSQKRRNIQGEEFCDKSLNRGQLGMLMRNAATRIRGVNDYLHTMRKSTRGYCCLGDIA